jgi:molecular chaperone IbpA
MRNLNTLSLTPLKKFAIGFDNLNQLMNDFVSGDFEAPSYPPYNIEKYGEGDYAIKMAVAGFDEKDLEIIVEGEKLIIKGSKQEKTNDDGKEYIHQGIAERNFEQKFELAGHVKVKNASLDQGILTIELKREIPEELKPKKIEISNSSKGAKKIEKQKTTSKQ